MTFTKTRVITARLEHNFVILSGNTYPIRNDIRTHGYTYHAADETWRSPATSDALAYARTIAQGLPPVDATTSYPADAPSVTVVQPPTPTQSDADSLAATGVQIIEQARRRIKRAADAEPAQTPSTSTSPDIAAALAAFVASIAPTQQTAAGRPVAGRRTDQSSSRAYSAGYRRSSCRTGRRGDARHHAHH